MDGKLLGEAKRSDIMSKELIGNLLETMEYSGISSYRSKEPSHERLY